MRRQIRKTFITFIGFVVLIIGIILIPYPGPGWLVVFIALGILSTEYAWAHRSLNYAKQKYVAWGNWVKARHQGIQLLISLFTLIVTVGTVWLLNGYGIINDSLNLGLAWLDSPLPIFHD